MHSPQRQTPSQRPTKPDTTPPAAPRPESVQLRARRSPKLIALGVLLVVLGGLGAAYLYTLNADHRAVIVMAADVRRGEVIEQSDLKVVEVPGDLGVDALGSDKFDVLVGQQALTDLPRGAFPSGAHVGDDPLPGGQSLVGLRLPLGKLPSTDIPLGTTVRIVGLEAPAQNAAEATGGKDFAEEVAVEAVTASAPRLLDDGATYVVDVRVADESADLVAKLSASDQAAIVVVGA